MLASLPGVLYEPPAHPSGIENIFARRMVLASGFRGSSLRLPLSGMVYCEIATRTLDLRACNPRRGRREDRAVKKCQSLMSRPQNLAFPRRQDSQLLTFVKRNDHLMTARSQDRLPTGIRLFSRPRIRDGREGPERSGPFPF